MLQNVLVVEDLDSVGYGICVMLEQEMGISQVILSQYCDDAYLKFRKALEYGPAFDLLITDLSFSLDYRKGKIKSGEDLIRKVRSLAKDIPIIVCSVEDKPNRLNNLFKNHEISAYVLKGRNGLKELAEAIKQVSQNKRYISPELNNSIEGNHILEISDYDIELLKSLSKGLSQNEIADLFKQKDIRPFGLSSIEKRLNNLKDDFQSKNTIQLIAIAKDLGLI